MNPCTPCTPLEVPPSTDASGKYLVIVNNDGETRKLVRPPGAAILIFDGDDAYFATGDDTLPIGLPSIRHLGAENDVLKGLIGVNNAGRLFSFNNETSAVEVLQSVSGNILWGPVPSSATGDTLPTTGFGFAIRTQALQTEDPTWLSGIGLAYMNALGAPELIANGNSGQILKMVSSVPTWVPPDNGVIASGGAGRSLDGVFAGNSNDDTVIIRIPHFVLSNGVDQVTLSAVSVDLSLSNPNGLGGLDTGAEVAAKWYYYYVTSDGIGAVNGIISENKIAPDLTGTGHDYFAFAGCFRNDGVADIIKFRQRGRDFWTLAQQWGTGLSVTDSFAAIVGSAALNTLIPPDVYAVSGIVGGADNAVNPRAMAMASLIDGVGVQIIGSRELSAGGSLVIPGETGDLTFLKDSGTFKDLVIDDASSPALYWKASASDNKRQIAITGYRI